MVTICVASVISFPATVHELSNQSFYTFLRLLLHQRKQCQNRSIYGLSNMLDVPHAICQIYPSKILWSRLQWDRKLIYSLNENVQHQDYRASVRLAQALHKEYKAIKIISGQDHKSVMHNMKPSCLCRQTTLPACSHKSH